MPKRNDVTYVVFYIYDDKTGGSLTGESTASISVYVSKDGGAFSRITSPAIAAVDAANMPGFYRLTLTATDTDAAHIVLRFESTTPGAVIEPCERYFDDTPGATQIADAVLGRNVAEVENAAPLHSLCTIVLAHLESSVTDSQWRIRRTDGTTQHALLAVSTDTAAKPVTGVRS